MVLATVIMIVNYNRKTFIVQATDFLRLMIVRLPLKIFPSQMIFYKEKSGKRFYPHSGKRSILGKNFLTYLQMRKKNSIFDQLVLVPGRFVNLPSHLTPTFCLTGSPCLGPIFTYIFWVPGPGFEPSILGIGDECFTSELPPLASSPGPVS
jgi:hypothetical protein